MVQSVLARLDPSQIVFDPQPYVFTTEALDPAYFAELAAAFPSLEKVAGPGPYPNNKAYLMQAREALDDPQIPAVWREFVAYHTSREFLFEALAFWRSALEREYPDLERRFGKPLSALTTERRYPGKRNTPENRQADVMMETQFGVNSPCTGPTSVRGPHVDDTHKLYAGLLYFRLPEDETEGADLTLYRYRTRNYHQDGRQDVPEKFVEPFRVVPYRPNTFVMYVNTWRSIHGVSPRSVTPLPRRYVNIQAECYNLTTGEFFPVRRTLAGRVSSAVKRVVGMRDA
ncbi:MAG: hypothetical protein ACFCUO_05505 [Rhodospirillales bacterium]